MNESNTFFDFSITGDSFLLAVFGVAAIAIVTVIVIRLKQVNNKKEK